MKKIGALIVSMMLLLVVSCEDMNNFRTPERPVNINIGTLGQWVTYGVHAYGEYRMFVREIGLPDNPPYPYTANSYTGYGGVLLIMGYDYKTGSNTAPMAFDMSCPVENKPDVRVTIDKNNYDAVCPVCGSRFSVIEAGGAPLSGPARDKKYGGLKTYSVDKTTSGGYIIRNNRMR